MSYLQLSTRLCGTSDEIAEKIYAFCTMLLSVRFPRFLESKQNPIERNTNVVDNNECVLQLIFVSSDNLLVVDLLVPTALICLYMYQNK